MTDIVEFLLARIAEDERAAQIAAPAPWEYQDVESVGGGRICDTTVEIANMFYDPEGERVDPRIRKTVRSEQADLTAEHIVRWDPARVLAECEGKRQIVQLHDDDGHECIEDVGRPPKAFPVAGSMTVNGMTLAGCQTLRLLALPHADHPDYRSEWRP